MSDREENGKHEGEDRNDADRDERNDRGRDRDERDDRDRDHDERDRDRDDRERGGAKRETGEAVRWNDRGFGFIKPDSGGEDIFCHISAIKDGNMLKEGSKVEYEVRYDDRRGKDRAENVTGGIQGDDRGPPPKGDRDRGYGRDRDRGFGRDRGHGRDRGYGDRDRGFGRDRERGYGRDRDRDRDYRR